MVTTIKIPVSKSILEQIEGKVLKVSNITDNGEIELEIEECQFWDRMKKRNNAIDEGEGIELDAYKLEERYLL